jgi:hypothetical protein
MVFWLTGSVSVIATSNTTLYLLGQDTDEESLSLPATTMADAMRVTGHTVGRLHRVLLTSNMDVRQPAGIG